MGVPKRKQSKQRSKLRRSGKRYMLPILAKDKTDETLFKFHHVNPFNNKYKGKLIIKNKK